jgi:hypothetical protein
MEIFDLEKTYQFSTDGLPLLCQRRRGQEKRSVGSVRSLKKEGGIFTRPRFSFYFCDLDLFRVSSLGFRIFSLIPRPLVPVIREGLDRHAG